MNPIAYVMEGMTPVAYHDSYLVDLKIRNHAAMTNLTQGRATRTDMDDLIAMGNVTEALSRLGVGKEYDDITQDGLNALHDVGKRGVASGSFVLKAQEMNALNTLMELHDAQMEVITIRDMEKALKLVDQEFRQRKMRRIVERQT
jgi:hypothetical protein